MFDFNSVTVNSDNILNDIYLSTIDIRILFYNKYHILLDIKNINGSKHFQEITNISENEANIHKDSNNFVLLKENFYRILSEYFDDISGNTYTDNKGVIDEYISSDGVFEIFIKYLYNSDVKFYIKLVDNININDISLLSNYEKYNEICKLISDGCLNPITYYRFITSDGNKEDEAKFILNFNFFQGYLKYYWNKEKNIFYFIYDTEYIKHNRQFHFYTERYFYTFGISNDTFSNFLKHKLLIKKKISLLYKTGKITTLYSNVISTLQKNYKYVHVTISNDLTDIPEIVINSCCQRTSKGNETLNVLTIKFKQ